MCIRDSYKTFDLDYTPKEMIENKQWTFSGFYELLKSVNTIGDDRPIYSLALWNSLPTCAVYANGGDIRCV